MNLETDWLEPTGPELARKRGGRPLIGKTSTCKALKLKCAGCGAIIRGARKAFDTGLPTCACGSPFEPGDERATLALDVDYADAREAAELERIDRAASRRERASMGGAERKRCASIGCPKFARGEYCPDHEPAPAGDRRYATRGV